MQLSITIFSYFVLYAVARHNDGGKKRDGRERKKGKRESLKKT